MLGRDILRREVESSEGLILKFSFQNNAYQVENFGLKSDSKATKS